MTSALQDNTATGAAAVAELCRSDVPAVLLQLHEGFDPGDLFTDAPRSMPLCRLPGMPDAPPQPGRPRTLMSGTCGETGLLVVWGGFHLYDGHGPAACVLPVCAAASAGVRDAVVIEPVRGVRDGLKPGTFVAVSDMINRTGTSPLTGNLDAGGDSFPDMTEAFSQELTSEFVNAAAQVGVHPRVGVYQANRGPEMETPAETTAARANGVEIVGAGIAMEAVAARSLELRFMAAGLVGGLAATHANRPPAYEDMLEACRFCSRKLARLLRLMLPEL